MSKNIICPKCFQKIFWQTKDSRFKCKNCLYIFTLKPNPLNISNSVLEEVIFELLLEHSTNVILERINVSKYKLLKTLCFLRMLMVEDVIKSFQGTLKISSENFEIKNKIKNPIIGIFYLKEKVYAKILTNIKPEDLKSFLKNQEGKEFTSFFESWQKNTGIIYKGKLYKIISFKKSKEENYQIDSIETFWGYLKRKLSSKGGIRKEKLPLFLGEYVWKYNNRKLTLKEQKEKLLSLVYKKLPN